MVAQVPMWSVVVEPVELAVEQVSTPVEELELVDLAPRVVEVVAEVELAPQATTEVAAIEVAVEAMQHCHHGQ